MTLRDGRRVHVRPIVPSGAPDLAAAAAAADDDTMYLRFFTPRPRLSARQLRYLTEVDYRLRLALVAFDAGWRRAGLAAALRALLEEAARHAGIRRLAALHLADNLPAAAMLAAAGYGSPTVADGITTVTRLLPPKAPN